MAARDRLHLLLELEVGSDPIVGSLSADGRRVTFAGWVGLATALESMMALEANRRPEPPARRPPSADLPGLG